MAAEKTEEFIQTIEKHPMLWDVSHVSYKNVKRKAVIWAEIAAEFTISVDEARNKWKRLRDSYIRATSKKKNSGDAAEEPESSWKYKDIMSFVEKSRTPRKTCSNYMSSTVVEKDNGVGAPECSDFFGSLTESTIEDAAAAASALGSAAMEVSTSQVINIDKSCDCKRSKNRQSKDVIEEKLLNAIEKMQNFCERRENVPPTDEDEDALFCKILRSKLKCLPLDVKNQVKLEVLRFVSQHEQAVKMGTPQV